MCTEVGKFNADFWCYRKNELIEVEIKTSKSDLNADFKKKKHILYKTGRHYWIPNRFYFAVPEELVKYALAKSVSYGYGVMVVSDKGSIVGADDVRIIKRSSKLHDRLPNNTVIRNIEQRLMSEMANLRVKLQGRNDDNTIWY